MTSDNLTRPLWNGTERNTSEKLRHPYEMKRYQLGRGRRGENTANGPLGDVAQGCESRTHRSLAFLGRCNESPVGGLSILSAGGHLRLQPRLVQ
jgi:hypothetical protein